MNAKLSDVSTKYGAPFGRVDSPIDAGRTLYLSRIRLNSQGYDSGGAYWGIGKPLYRVSDGSEGYFIRARDRYEAKSIVRKDYPEAKFFR